MSKIRYFYIFPALLALALCFSGCEDGPPDSPNTTSPNASIYYAKAPDNKHVFLSIYSVANKALLPPNSGDHYAVAVFATAYDDSPVAEGQISVSGDIITFAPNSQGKLSDPILLMSLVPSTTYEELAMTYIRNASRATLSNPFGSDSLTPPGSTNPSPPPSGSGGSGAYIPGNIVTKLEVVVQPNWGAASGTGTKFYYEGDKINLGDTTDMQVRVTYQDSTSEIIRGSFSNYFLIDPPDFKSYTSTDPYKLYWKNGFTNSKTVGTNTSLSPTFKGPSGTDYAAATGGGGVLCELGIKSGWASTDSTLSTNFIKTTTEQLTEWFIDEYYFYASQEVPLQIVYTDGIRNNYYKNNNLATSNTDTTEVVAYTQKKLAANTLHYYTHSTTDSTVTVKYGSKGLSFQIPNKFTPKSITASRPNFAEQILFDDPRLFNNPDTVNWKAQWLSKIVADVGIDVQYNGTTKTMHRTAAEAYNYSALRSGAGAHDFIEPPDPIDLSKAAIGFIYWGLTNNYAAFEVPVYNIVSEITVTDNSPDGFPLMKKTGNDAGYNVKEAHNQFMQKILVSATYQSGKGGPEVYRQDAWGQAQESNTNRSCTSTFSSSISLDDSFLIRATNNYEKGKMTKATVWFIPSNGGVQKSDSIEIGAVGYIQ